MYSQNRVATVQLPVSFLISTNSSDHFCHVCPLSATKFTPCQSKLNAHCSIATAIINVHPSMKHNIITICLFMPRRGWASFILNNFYLETLAIDQVAKLIHKLTLQTERGDRSCFPWNINWLHCSTLVTIEINNSAINGMNYCKTNSTMKWSRWYRSFWKPKYHEGSKPPMSAPNSYIVCMPWLGLQSRVIYTKKQVKQGLIERNEQWIIRMPAHTVSLSLWCCHRQSENTNHGWLLFFKASNCTETASSAVKSLEGNTWAKARRWNLRSVWFATWACFQT